MKNTTKSAKTAKITKVIYNIPASARFTPLTDEQRENTNWNAKLYRDRAQNFYNSASFSAPSPAVAVPLTKSALKKTIAAGLEAAKKVRHNNTKAPITIAKFAIIDGIPHKRVNGEFVPLTPAAQSKKWDVA
jgi:UV DNA damage repair endonuclease